MKRILSFLLCIILLKAQAFAIHGNLEGTDSGTILTGTYSGTLIPDNDDAGTRVFDFTTGEQTGIISTIGLFSVAMPTSGVGTGSFVIFTQGRSFSGTIVAIGDPTAGTLTGILEATYEYPDFARDDNYEIIRDILGQTTPVTRQAAVRGSLNAQVQSTIANITAETALSGNFGRIAGTATTGNMFLGPTGESELVSNGITTYIVDGVKQSLTPDSTASLTSSTDTQTLVPFFLF